MRYPRLAAIASTLLLAACTESIETGGSVHALGHQQDCPPTKVLICHMPPGNPTNVQEICVGPSAVAAHVSNHGDHLGACYPAECTPNDNPCGDALPPCCTGFVCGPTGLCE
jgi:hypothetical protein